MIRRILPRLGRLLAGAALAAAAQAAVVVDLDVARLRATPDAQAIAAQLDAALPAEAQRRLAALALLTGSDPRRDLTRVILDLPGDGGGSARLVGMPATRLAALIDLHSTPIALPGGLAAHPLPRRPELAFVPLADEVALIARADRVAGILAAPRPAAAVDARSAAIAAGAAPAASRPALPPPAAAPIAIVFTPGAHPPAAFAGVRHATAAGDGAGQWTIAVEAEDAAAAEALVKRVAALQAMVADGASGGLPAAQRWAPVLAAATVQRDGAVLHLAITVPTEVRDAAIGRLVERLRRAGRG